MVMRHLRVIAMPGTPEPETTYYVRRDNGTYDIYVVGKDGVVKEEGDAGSAPESTDDVPEGEANLYFTSARVNAILAAAIGVTVQAYHATLDALAAVTTTVFGRSLLGLADAAGLTAEIDTFTATAKGAVPAPGAGTPNNRFLQAGGGFSVPRPVWYVGRDPGQGWQTHYNASAIGSLATASYVALIVGTAGNYNRLTCYCQAASAGATLRAALYAAAADNGPGPLLADFGTATLDTTGYKTLQLAAPIWLEPGIYWVLHQASSATPTFRGANLGQPNGGGSVNGTIVGEATTGRLVYLDYATAFPADMSAFTIGTGTNQLQFTPFFTAAFLLR